VSVDLNSDIGEIRGGLDPQIVKLVSSVNISCGVHAGDRALTASTIVLARDAGVAIGAHPGMPGSFGRTETEIDPNEAFAQMRDQLISFFELAAPLGVAVTHVKPHGALYNQAETSPEIASAIVNAVSEIDRGLAIYGLAGGKLIAAAKAAGFRTIGEYFADRVYEADGTLRTRSHLDAVIDDTQDATNRVIEAIKEQSITTRDGSKIPIRIESICVHGDNAQAVEMIEAVRNSLLLASIEIKSP